MTVTIGDTVMSILGRFHSKRRGFIIGGAAVLALMASPLIIEQLTADHLNFGAQAWAAEDGSSTQGHQYKGGRQGESGSGAAGGGHEATPRGGKGGVKDVLRGEGERVPGPGADSDAPPWAGPNATGTNPHQQGGGKPGGAGSKKGDVYGDMWVVLRDVNGVPILVKWTDSNEDGINDTQVICTSPSTGCFVQPLDSDGNPIPLDAEGAPLDETATQEVDLGRLNVGRAPSTVSQHSLDEAISAISSATSLTLDTSGRLVVDGTAIDSPLENLALYVAIMTNDPKLASIEDKLRALYDANHITYMDLASSLLAGAADKTGEITTDLVAYMNVILGISPMTADNHIDYTTFDYNRDTTYSGDITYYVQKTDGTVVSVTEPILQAVFDGQSYTSDSGMGIADFAQAADDALEVIDFVHTQIHTE